MGYKYFMNNPVSGSQHIHFAIVDLETPSFSAKTSIVRLCDSLSSFILFDVVSFNLSLIFRLSCLKVSLYQLYTNLFVKTRIIFLLGNFLLDKASFLW